MRSVIHPRMLDRMVGSFPSRATVQAPVSTRSPSGAIVTTWSTLAGMVGIPCAVAPVSGSERQASQLTTSETTHTVALQGAFPAIGPAHRLVVSGPGAGVYDITAAATDSHGLTTRLSCRRGTPTAEPGA